MEQELIETVDRYIEGLFVADDPALQAAVASSVEAGLPQIHVTPGQGKFLYLLARLCRARRILEIGTLAGYSAIWLARALPDDGRLVSLELDPDNAALARENLARAGIADRVDVRIGRARDTLATMAARDDVPFDMAFIDADKAGYPVYLQYVVGLLRPGGLIVADNVVRGGRVLAPEPADEAARGAHAFNEALAAEPRVEATVLQQVGTKGHDGMAIAVVRRRD